jgi:uncharacterized protein DUF4386
MGTAALTNSLQQPPAVAGALDPAQQTAARVVGVLYLLTMATAMFSQLYVDGQLLVRGDALLSARNIAASEQLFRVGIVFDLATVAGVVALVWALYVILKPVNRNLAMLAAVFRFVECSIIAATISNAFVTLRVLEGADYLSALGTEHSQALARLVLVGQGAGFLIAFVFLGIGSTVFSVLWFKSGYIPRALAAWGVFSSSTLAIVTLANMVFPSLGDLMGLAYMAPMFIYEVGLGLWLLVIGIKAPVAA